MDPRLMRAADLLLQAKLLPVGDFHLVDREVARSGERSEEVLLALQVFTESTLLRALSGIYKTSFVSSERLQNAILPPRAIARVPQAFAQEHTACPVLWDPTTETLAVATPNADEAPLAEKLVKITGAKRVVLLVALPRALRAVLLRAYSARSQRPSMAPSEHPGRGTSSSVAVRALDLSPQIFLDPPRVPEELVRAASLPPPPVAPPAEPTEPAGGAPHLDDERPTEPPPPDMRTVTNAPKRVNDDVTVFARRVPSLPRAAPAEPKPAIATERPTSRPPPVAQPQTPNFPKTISTAPSQGPRRSISPLPKPLESLGLTDPSSEARRRAYEPAPVPEGAPPTARGLTTNSTSMESAAALSLVAVLVTALEAQQGPFPGHGALVSKISAHLAHVAGLPAEESHALQLAAWLHDLGRTGRGHLTVRSVSRSARLVSTALEVLDAPLERLRHVPLPELARTTIRQLWERPDGEGIPSGIQGPTIVRTARILAVADVLADLLGNPANESGRVLRAHEAIERIERGSGTLYDPATIDHARLLAASGAMDAAARSVI